MKHRLSIADIRVGEDVMNNSQEDTAYRYAGYLLHEVWNDGQFEFMSARRVNEKDSCLACSHLLNRTCGK